MSNTWRGVIIFVAALVTIWLWAPLSNSPSRTQTGVVITETFFGPLNYLTVRTELKEPDYAISHQLQSKRLALTAFLTAVLWSVVIWKVGRKPLTNPDPSDAKP